LTVTGPALFSGSYEVGTGAGKTLLMGAIEIDNLALGIDGGWTSENAGTLSLQTGTIYLGYDPLTTDQYQVLSAAQFKKWSKFGLDLDRGRLRQPGRAEPRRQR
jgi:hypothetical protein